MAKSGKSIKGSKVLVLGVSYKKDVGDVRESPALDLIDLLGKKKALVSYHDPYVKKVKVDGKIFKNSPISPQLLKKYDCVVVITAHSCLDIRQIQKSAKVLIDTRNALGHLKHDSDKIRLLGGGVF